MARRSGRRSRAAGSAFPLPGLLRSLTAPRRRRGGSQGAAAAALSLVPLPSTPRLRSKLGAGTGRGPTGRWLTAAYTGPAGSRSYDVYLPAGHRRSTRVPLVILLHGCDQTARDFVAATRFTSLADRQGFVVVAPRQSRTYQPGGCWRWYEAAHQARGSGEPAILAGIITAVLAEPSRWRIEPSRVYVAGISAGAGMALVLASTYPELFAAVGVHSGPGYRSATSGTAARTAMRGQAGMPPPGEGPPLPPLIVFQGVADRVVHARTADQVVQQWLAQDAVARPDPRDPHRVTRSRVTEHRTTDGRRATVTRWYSARGRKRLEYWRVDGLGHGWSGGLRDGSYSDHRGPRASTAMWRFFTAHTRRE